MITTPDGTEIYLPKKRVLKVKKTEPEEPCHRRKNRRYAEFDSEQIREHFKSSSMDICLKDP